MKTQKRPHVVLFKLDRILHKVSIRWKGVVGLAELSATPGLYPTGIPIDIRDFALKLPVPPHQFGLEVSGNTRVCLV